LLLKSGVNGLPTDKRICRALSVYAKRLPHPLTPSQKHFLNVYISPYGDGLALNLYLPRREANEVAGRACRVTLRHAQAVTLKA
jgi:hypothetical protein